MRISLNISPVVPKLFSGVFNFFERTSEPIVLIDFPRSRANPFAWLYNSKRPQLPSEIKFDKVNPFPRSRANPFAWLYNSKSPQLPSEIKFPAPARIPSRGSTI